MNRNIFTFIQNIHDYRKIPNSIIHRRMKNDSKFNNRDYDESTRSMNYLSPFFFLSNENPAASRRYLRIHAADAHNGADSWHLIRALSRLAPRLPPYNSLYSS